MLIWLILTFGVKKNNVIKSTWLPFKDHGSNSLKKNSIFWYSNIANISDVMMQIIPELIKYFKLGSFLKVKNNQSFFTVISYQFL